MAQAKRSYTKRFQTRLRRRREGKTDYQHRYNMVRQDANKHGMTKLRFVVRITNSRVLCSLVQAHVNGDRTVAHADSTELAQHGVAFGLTNYTAAYATGLLLAQRYLRTADAPRCFLDIGLSRSTKGSRVFSAMKGAVDGGLEIPHNMKKFPGYSAEKDEFDSGVFRDRILGKALSAYMKEMMENSPDEYKRTFSGYVKKGINPGDLGGIYEAAFESIRSHPGGAERTRKDYSSLKSFKKAKLGLDERRSRAAAKLRAGAKD